MRSAKYRLTSMPDSIAACASVRCSWRHWSRTAAGVIAYQTKHHPAAGQCSVLLRDAGLVRYVVVASGVDGIRGDKLVTRVLPEFGDGNLCCSGDPEHRVG